LPDVEVLSDKFLIKFPRSKLRTEKKVSFMKKIYSGFLMVTLLLLPLISITGQVNRGVGIKVKTGSGESKEINLYDNSYALIIGNSNYTNGWDSLTGVASDVIAVRDILEKHGFNVQTEENLTGPEMTSKIDKFIGDYGFVSNNRLLIYYAGHGHTLKSSGDGRELGYIVPVNAPLPKKDEMGFRKTAIPMDDIQNFAKKIQSKHALFLFDSCFSGKLVTRNAIRVPAVIEEKVSFAVRQFITAGSANQPVPDESIFRRSFVRGLEGEADLNQDGYITGTELAEHLKEKVTNYSNGSQTPQYGKINDIALDRGDYVFALAGQKGTTTDQNTAEVRTEPKEIVTDPNAGERAVWNQIKDSPDRRDYELFLRTFPSGIYKARARARYEQVWWEAIKSSQKSSDFLEFKKEFPSGQYAIAADFTLRRMGVTTSTGSVTTPESNGNSTDKKPEKSEEILVRKIGATSKSKLPNGAAMTFVYIPAGEFQMGSEDEKPIHNVRISQEFWIGQTEVTQAQWISVMGDLPAECDGISINGPFMGENKPIICTGWTGAQEFIARLNQLNDGYKYRLPTEAEWEYACRAGTTGDFAGGVDAMGWYVDNTLGRGQTHNVGLKQPNAWGLYDMHGNVWEFVEDWYGDYPGESVTDPKGPTSGEKRVYRGGSWRLSAKNLKSSKRAKGDPDTRYFKVGFRVVRTN
jgi:formylglycine-generating enzyme required for sulfatase activity/uncharacterized caspase-like protein